MQALWTLLLIGLASVVEGDVELLQAMRGLSALIAIVALILLQRLLMRWCGFAPQLVACLLLTLFLTRPVNAMGGMELPLNLLMHLVAALAVTRLNSASPGGLIQAGVAVALTTLVRVDNLIFTPAYAALALWRLSELEHGAQRPPLTWTTATRAVVWLALPSIIVFGSYVGWNQLVFDTPLPISGTAKSAYADAGPWSDRLVPSLAVAVRALTNLPNHLLGGQRVDAAAWSLPIGLLLGLAALGFAIGLVRKPHPLHYLVGLTTVVCTVAHLTAFAVLIPASMVINTRWYYGPELLLFLLALAALLERLRALSLRQPTFRVAFALATFALAALLAIDIGQRFERILEAKGRHTVIDRMAEAARYSNQNLPADAIIGAFDSGAFGYFTTARVVNLDGLMNNRELLPYLRRERPLMNYLKTHDIGWLMHIERRGQAAPAERMLASVDPACLDKVHRLAPRRHRKGQLRDLVIYRITCDGA